MENKPELHLYVEMPSTNTECKLCCSASFVP